MPDIESKCVFCGILAGKLPSFKVYENDVCFAILDINPIAKGQTLVIPKRHVERWTDLTAEETAGLFNGAREIANKMMQVLKPEFVVPFARGRRVPHAHIFLLPTWPGDLLDAHFGVLEQVALAAPQLAQTRDKSAMEEMARLLSASK